MASDPQAIARFPGVNSVLGGAFTWGHGETPGICVLNIAPQLKPPKLFGTLSLTYGGTRLDFPDCRVDSASYTRNSAGLIVSLEIQDWRWRWEGGFISGRYNRRDSEGALIAASEKSPQDLAKLCFAAMGQASYDVTGLPNQARPFVEWEVVNPAQALSALCEQLGCRIAPDFGNRAIIVKLGSGERLPRGPRFGLIDLEESLDPPNKPEAIIVIGGPTWYQHDFELEAVGLEADGTYVLLDELSYKPANGWTYSADDDFSGISDLKSRKLAQASVYRCYRIKIPAAGGRLPGYTDKFKKKIVRREQLVILNQQCEKETQPGSEYPSFRPPLLYGAFEGTNNFGSTAFDNTINEPTPIVDLDTDHAKKCTAHVGFQIDSERGIITTTEALVLIDEDHHPAAAKLRLRVAVNVRDEETDGFIRNTLERRFVKSPSVPAKIIRREELVMRVVTSYKPGSITFDIQSIEYNEAAWNKEANYYLDIEEKTWKDLTPAQANYGHLLRVSPDGAIQHVVWTFGHSAGATTRLGRNTEFKDYVTPYRERRQNAAVAELAGDGVAAQ